MIIDVTPRPPGPVDLPPHSPPVQLAIDTHARYRKTYAVLLPPLLPTLVALVQSIDIGSSSGSSSSSSGSGSSSGLPLGGFWLQRWWQISTAVGAAVGLLALWRYPRKGHLHGYAAGESALLCVCDICESTCSSSVAVCVVFKGKGRMLSGVVGAAERSCTGQAVFFCCGVL